MKTADLVAGALVDYLKRPGARPIRATVVEAYDEQVRITYSYRGGEQGELVKRDQLVVVPQSHAEKANAFHEQAVKAGKVAADAARSAGIELLIAKSEMEHGEWRAWCKANLTFSLRTAQVYMQLAKAQRAALSDAAEKSIREALNQLSREVDEIEEPETEEEKQKWEALEAKRAKEDAEWEAGREEREKQEAIRLEIVQRQNAADAEARKQEHALILEYITAGYWAMSKKHHPDKNGGPSDTQVRVTKVRDLMMAMFKNATPCQFCGK